MLPGVEVSIIAILRRHEDYCEFEASIVYTEHSGLAWVTQSVSDTGGIIKVVVTQTVMGQQEATFLPRTSSGGSSD